MKSHLNLSFFLILCWGISVLYECKEPKRTKMIISPEVLATKQINKNTTKLSIIRFGGYAADSILIEYILGEQPDELAALVEDVKGNLIAGTDASYCPIQTQVQQRCKLVLPYSTMHEGNFYIIKLYSYKDDQFNEAKSPEFKYSVGPTIKINKITQGEAGNSIIVEYDFTKLKANSIIALVTNNLGEIIAGMSADHCSVNLGKNECKLVLPDLIDNKEYQLKLIPYGDDNNIEGFVEVGNFRINK